MASGAGSQRLKELEVREISVDEAELEQPSPPPSPNNGSTHHQPQPAVTLSERDILLARQQMAAQIQAANVRIARDRAVNVRMMSLLKTVSLVLAGRFLLLLALLGAFVLATMAVQAQSWISLAILAAFCGLVLCPLIWTEAGTGTRANAAPPPSSAGD